MTVSYTPLALVKQAANILTNSETARLDAEYLMADVLQCKRMELPLRTGELTVVEATKFAGYLERRKAGEPVAHILGTQEFWSLEFKVTPATLIPRPDTETLVEVTLKHLSAQSKGTILDMGTGSGCVLLSLLSELPAYQGIGIDRSPDALAVASENAQNLGFSERIAFLEGDWFSNVETPVGGFAAIVSNPPYIPSADIDGLMQDVRDFEPLSALDGGEDGLNPYPIIAEGALECLRSGGLLAVELGIHQAESVADIFRGVGFAEIEITNDLAGIGRVVSGKKV